MTESDNEQQHFSGDVDTGSSLADNSSNPYQSLTSGLSSRCVSTFGTMEDLLDMLLPDGPTTAEPLQNPRRSLDTLNSGFRSPSSSQIGNLASYPAAHPINYGSRRPDNPPAGDTGETDSWLVDFSIVGHQWQNSLWPRLQQI